jgi:uncharacterized membrane protein
MAARRIDAVSAVLVAFIAAALSYMYFGFSAPLADLTLWGRSSPFRFDLALGLAQTLLLAWLIAQAQGAAPIERRWATWAAALTAIATALSAASTFRLVPVPILDAVSPAVIALSCLALGIVAYLLLTQRFAWAIGIHCAWMLGASVPFNPLAQAPTRVALAPGLTKRLAIPGSVEQRRVAILGEHSWTTTVVAAGQPVVNTVMYYPQPSLWKALDPSGAQRTLYDRYQHLLFELAPLPPGPAYRIDSPRLDAVRVTFDPERFDFRLLSAGGVLTPERNVAALGANATLRREAKQDGWAVYRVVR